jgi:hypothetical protein
MKGDAWFHAIERARRLVSANDTDDWQWLTASLEDPDRKWFVAAVFEKQPVPKRLLSAFLRAAVYEENPSFNRQFIEPCVRSYGSTRVATTLLRYLENGTNHERAGAASAFFWCLGLNGSRGTPSEDISASVAPFQERALRAFVGNDDLAVRRRIIPMLALRPGSYPPTLASLVARAIDIARTHSDEYIRHRVEVQLGVSTLLWPLPSSLQNPSDKTTS